MNRPSRPDRLRERQNAFGLGGWECRCALCTASNMEVSASKKIRLEIRDMKARFLAAPSIELKQLEDYN